MLNGSNNGTTGGKGENSTSGNILEIIQIADHDRRKPTGDNISEITQAIVHQ